MISWFMIGGLITVPDSPHVLWNDIVDWTTEVVRYNSMQKGLLFIKYCDGYLIPRIFGIVDGQYMVFDGERVAMTKEDRYRSIIRSWHNNQTRIGSSFKRRRDLNSY